MLRLIRLNAWWNTIVPQVLGWIYFSRLLGYAFSARHPELPYPVDGPGNLIQHFVFFFAALVFIAAFGYLFNDLCDIKSDAAAGKPNKLSSLPAVARILLVGLALVAGIAAWYKLNTLPALFGVNMRAANILFGLQLLALIVYSAPPLRVKDRAETGAMFDAFYGHLNPVLITLCVFGYDTWQHDTTWSRFFIAFVFGVCLVKGVRNILLHQIEDRKKDNTSNINTVVLKYGPWRVINFVNQYLFPAEIFLLVGLMLIISLQVPPCIVPVIFFAVISYLKLSGWKLGYADRRLVEFKFTYFMNDFYEVWLPVFLLAFLCVYQHRFVFLLILHLVLFPMFWVKLVKDFSSIKENFKREEDY